MQKIVINETCQITIVNLNIRLHKKSYL